MAWPFGAGLPVKSTSGGLGRVGPGGTVMVEVSHHNGRPNPPLFWQRSRRYRDGGHPLVLFLAVMARRTLWGTKMPLPGLSWATGRSDRGGWRSGDRWGRHSPSPASARPGGAREGIIAQWWSAIRRAAGTSRAGTISSAAVVAQSNWLLRGVSSPETSGKPDGNPVTSQCCRKPLWFLGLRQASVPSSMGGRGIGATVTRDEKK